MANKPSIPKGTRDFLPTQSLKRQYIFDTAKTVFQLHGFQPIETPAMENLETLTGKYGEEGDRLIFKILNSGMILDSIQIGQGEINFWADGKGESESGGFSPNDIIEYYSKLYNTDSESIAASKRNNEFVRALSEKALRYDLTVPFARFVVQNQNELSFPFKRYQIQPVWRADRPQKGRYREFYQCDVDVIGSDSLLNEAELIIMIAEVFQKLGLPDVQIRLNNRKILSGIATSAGLSGYFKEMTIAIDKLDKIGIEGVKEEMLKRGLPEAGVKKVIAHLKRKGDADTVLRMLQGAMTGVQEALKGIDEVKQVLKALPPDVKKMVEIDLTLARGLDYYTGAIIEVGHADFPSSICGGGRYDDLTGIFGLPDMSGVGVSFGADRIYDLMEEKGLFPDSLKASSRVLFVNFGTEESLAAFNLASELRANGISSEVYPDNAKMKKQMKYADSKGVDFTVIIGSEELKQGKVTVKNMQFGEQLEVAQNELTAFILKNSPA